MAGPTIIQAYDNSIAATGHEEKSRKSSESQNPEV
jgi:hypothetical protein